MENGFNNEALEDIRKKPDDSILNIIAVCVFNVRRAADKKFPVHAARYCRDRRP